MSRIQFITWNFSSFSLQKFKLSIANTVIGQDNSNLQSMNTSDLLDLFQVSGSSQQQPGKTKVLLLLLLMMVFFILLVVVVVVVVVGWSTGWSQGRG